MKITNVEHRREYFYRVTFARDGESVEKTVQLTGLALKVSTDRRRDMIVTLAKAAREADRDIAYRLHGAAFRDHCEYKDNFWSLLSPEEVAKIIPTIN